MEKIFFNWKYWFLQSFKIATTFEAKNQYQLIKTKSISKSITKSIPRATMMYYMCLSKDIYIYLYTISKSDIYIYKYMNLCKTHMIFLRKPQLSQQNYFLHWSVTFLKVAHVSFSAVICVNLGIKHFSTPCETQVKHQDILGNEFLRQPCWPDTHGNTMAYVANFAYIVLTLKAPCNPWVKKPSILNQM